MSPGAAVPRSPRVAPRWRAGRPSATVVRLGAYCPPVPARAFATARARTQRIAEFARISTDPVRLFSGTAAGKRAGDATPRGARPGPGSGRLLAEERTRAELYARLRELNQALADMIPEHERRWGRWARAEAYLDAIHHRDVQNIEREAELGNLQRTARQLHAGAATASDPRSPRGPGRAAPPFR
mmetsp:Transcript_17554/g.45365  ORF Transcript_17554/g.45365 Transcript_17554/m.45365 type:complete len:185 (+) Transcript_17554:94-648(+)